MNATALALSGLILPELALLLVVLGLFVHSLLFPGLPDARQPAQSGQLGQSVQSGQDPHWAVWALGAVLLVALFSQSVQGLILWGSYKIDGLSQFFKMLVAGGLLVTVLNGWRQPQLDRTKRADYLMLLCLSALGLMLLSSAVELITIYVALELSSFSLYALVPLRAGSRQAAEAGVKYILFGAVATAIGLYGFSWIVAAHSTGYLAELAGKSFSFADSRLAAVGLTLFMAGFFYKLALFPFHFWCPDVYDGASNETAAYIATLPKLGAIVVLVRLASLLAPGLEVTTALAVMGAISMTFGNLAALAQKDVKRLLGFSSVAHAGYLMLGLVAGTAEGLAAAAYYGLVYMVMNLACFWVLCRLSPSGENVSLDDLDGLHRRAPGLAFILAVSAFALVGLPPTAGFMGKLFLLTSAWGRGYDWLVVVAALNTAISIGYYLGMVRHAYTGQGESSKLAVGEGSLLVGGVLATVILILGAVPGPVFEYAAQAGAGLMP